MGIEVRGFAELADDLGNMAEKASGSAINKSLEAGAEPVLRKAMGNISGMRKTGELEGSLTIGPVKANKGRKRITIGTHAGTAAAKYAMALEYGHGGPHPAPPHPFMMPAYDATKEDAYAAIRDTLRNELKEG